VVEPGHVEAGLTELTRLLQQRERVGEELRRCVQDLAAVSDAVDALRTEFLTGLPRRRPDPALPQKGRGWARIRGSGR